jgi:hypothetical protein
VLISWGVVWGSGSGGASDSEAGDSDNDSGDGDDDGAPLGEIARRRIARKQQQKQEPSSTSSSAAPAARVRVAGHGLSGGGEGRRGEGRGGEGRRREGRGGEAKGGDGGGLGGQRPYVYAPNALAGPSCKSKERAAEGREGGRACVCVCVCRTHQPRGADPPLMQFPLDKSPHLLGTGHGLSPHRCHS